MARSLPHLSARSQPLPRVPPPPPPGAAYLRPETAQGIFINYKNVLGTSRQKLPFGIAQVGKAFRNEITPRNFVFRSREFEQMEIEYFIPPGDDVWQPYHEQWISDAEVFLKSIGLNEELMGYDVHEGDGLAHYARACTDITFRFPFGVQELMGIAARGDYDLRSHSEGSGKGACAPRSLGAGDLVVSSRARARASWR